MTFELKAGVATLALILAPLALEAAPKGEQGNNGHSTHADHGNSAFGHAHQHGSATDEDGDDELDIAASGSHSCAPGVADRATPCVPPGQARQGVTIEDWIRAPTDGFAVGQDISDESYGLISNTDQLGLDEDALEVGEA
jgi:hypothetical protein